MKITLTALVFLCFHTLGVLANAGYNIKVNIEGYRERKLTLAYYFGNQQYIKDTVKMGADGAYTFSGQTPLLPGIYTLVMTPTNVGIDLLVSEKEQQFSVQTKKASPHADLKFIGSKENELFQQYIHFVSKHNPQLDTLRAQYKRSAEGPKKEKIKQALQKVDSTVQQYLQEFLRVNKDSYAALVIKSSLSIRYPSFSGTDEEKVLKTWLYARKHCFDNVPLTEFRLLRTPHFYQAVTTYVNELLFQHPDSINAGIDYILNQLRPNREAFDYYAIHFLRQYLQPKVMGMDAVFVHLAETYLETGEIQLSNPAQKAKLIQMAQKLKPLLIGKIAPNIALTDRAGKTFNLHDLESEYTLLVIWAYDCGHCKQSAPFWKSFYEKFKDKGVKLLALCHVPEKELPTCWKYVDDNGYGAWLHAADPLFRYAKAYNVESTPQVYLMDRKKVIIGKQIVAEKMEEVIAQIIELRKKNK
ncbi:MAG: redoxin domain-containing protein [Haliscomenobacter sp.]|nr:TlpA disulfide reductase family protein [Haliscomenobacter sp.]MBK9490221.1 redoxin domain-containing protein [Haliscomenobacter sp.]